MPVHNQGSILLSYWSYFLIWFFFRKRIILKKKRIILALDFWYLLISINQSICLSVCLPVCLFVCLPIYLPIYLHLNSNTERPFSPEPQELNITWGKRLTMAHISWAHSVCAKFYLHLLGNSMRLILLLFTSLKKLKSYGIYVKQQ